MILKFKKLRKLRIIISKVQNFSIFLTCLKLCQNKTEFSTSCTRLSKFFIVLQTLLFPKTFLQFSKYNRTVFFKEEQCRILFRILILCTQAELFHRCGKRFGELCKVLGEFSRLQFAALV